MQAPPGIDDLGCIGTMENQMEKALEDVMAAGVVSWFDKAYRAR